MANKRFIVKNGLDNSGDNSVVNTIINVAEPTNNSDAATKYYVDTHSSGGTVTAVTGTLPVESTGGTAPDISLGTASNGQLLIGTGTGFTKSTLTQGTGVTITNASGAITIAATGSGGDVVGPASSTDNAIVRFDSTTGKLIQDSTATLSDGGIMIVTELDTDSIKSATANSPVTIAPNGTGDVHLNTDSIRIGDNNADATIATRGTGDLIITTHEGSANEGIVRLYDGVNGDITLTPNGTGQVKVGTDQVVTLVASQTLTNKTISGSANTLSNIANASLTNSTISGVALGSNLNALTISSPLTGASFNGSSAVSIGIPVATTSANGYLSSTDWTTFNNKGSGSVTSVTGGTYLTGGTITTTGTLAVDATSANTASKVVARDASGNFSAGTITANLTGNASGSSGSTTGNAATATALQTARAINGVNFDGTAAITVTAAAGTLTGATLASGVTASSLTSVGTLTGLSVSGANVLVSAGYGIAYSADQARIMTPEDNVSGALIAWGSGGICRFLSASTERVRIDASGNVGIGTASPNGVLTVFNATTFNARTSGINVHRPSAYGQYGSFAYDGDITYLSSTYTGGGAGTYGLFVFQGYDSTSTPREYLRILSSGNVGIGTSSPVVLKSATTLQVYGNIKVGNDNARGLVSLGDVSSTGANAGIWRGAAGAYGSTGNYLCLGGYDGITFTTGNADIASQTERVRIDSSGNVGIGTASPTNKLQVNGVMVGNNAAGSYTKGFGGILTTTSTSTPTGGSSGDFALIY